MEDKEKSRHTVWLSDEAWKLVERMYKDDNCPTRNEFVEKAIRFYDGYLHTSRASAFLPKVLLDVLEGSLGVYCGRVGKLLFNLAVEHSITTTCWRRTLIWTPKCTASIVGTASGR